jgi:hypothetical protein
MGSEPIKTSHEYIMKERRIGVWLQGGNYECKDNIKKMINQYPVSLFYSLMEF